MKPKKEEEVKCPWHNDCELIETLMINTTDENDLVLDPYMGSGTTAKVAKDLGRNYIGIELNPDYIKIANQRLAQEVLL